MRLGLAVCAIVAAIGAVRAAPNAQVVGPAPGTPLGYVQRTSLTASYTLAPPTGANVVCITPETQAVRFRDDGTAPTATVGYPITVGQTLCYKGSISGAGVNSLASIKIIEQTASASVNLLYYQQ